MTLRLLCAFLLLAATAGGAQAWRIETVETPVQVGVLTEAAGEPRLATPDGWYRMVRTDTGLRFEKAEPPRLPPVPSDALPDARIAAGRKQAARAWFAEPTKK